MDYLLCIDSKDKRLVKKLVRFCATAERAKAGTEKPKQEVDPAEAVSDLEQQMARLVMVARGRTKRDTINALREFADIRCPPSPAEATDAQLARWMKKNSAQVAQMDEIWGESKNPSPHADKVLIERMRKRGATFQKGIGGRGKRDGATLDL